MIVRVKVKPNSEKQEIRELNGVYLVCLKEKAKDNKANIGLLKLLKRKFGGEVKIIKGLRSNKKVVEIKNGD